MSDVADIARGLTKAQRAAVIGAIDCEPRGPYRPAGLYCSADKRVRWKLAVAGVIRDYLGPSNRLTPLGLAVRAHLIGGGQ